MLFNSYTFILFFAGLLVLHRLPLAWRTKKFNLLWASYVFYAAWNPPLVVLLWISTVTDWVIGRWIHAATRPATRRVLLLASLAVNLGLLGYFKYGGFLLENFVALLQILGIDYAPAVPDIVLPVGISFYTFQTLSYTLDIHAGRARPWHSFLDYAVYVTFLPQLVAGPIVRANQFLPQCEEPRQAGGRELGWGLALVVIGLFEKIVVADSLLAPVADSLYGDLQQPGFAAAWYGTLAFAGQIFCDFAGYSTCAIGIALSFGFILPDNFRFPYAAIGFSDFWHRWHISLSSWLRDYLYIPLGGNRLGAARTSANLMLTMLIGGLWHGASWTFVVWGGLHGLYLLVERFLRVRVVTSSFWRRSGGQLLLGAVTFALVCIAWVFFRAESFGQAFRIVTAMLGVAPGPVEFGLTGDAILVTRATMIALLLVHWGLRDTSLEAAAARCPWPVRALILAAMLCAIVTSPGEDRAFIYFQF